MAEKNTESTAVNQLIELVATAKPLPPDPSEDLMFSAPSKRATKQMSPPRMTATVPPVRVAGDVAPLPRTRAPVGTQQGLQTIKAVPPAMPSAMPPAVPKVRISTAPPSRTLTIPPVAQAAPLTLDHDEENEVTNPEHDVMSRVTKQTLPPPLPTVRGVGGTGSRPSLPPPHRPSAPRPSLPTQSFDYPVVKHQAQELPVVAPPIAAPLVLENELVTSMSTTNPSMSKFEVHHSTAQVPKAGDWKAIASKLVAPMVVLVIVGIFVGGYFAFDGDGGKKHAAKSAAAMAQAGEEKPEPVEVAKDEPKAEPVATEPAPAVAPAIEAAPVGAKVEEPKAEPAPVAAKVEEPKAEPATAVAKSEPAPAIAKSEPAPAVAKSEPAKTEPAIAKTEPAKTESAPAVAKTAPAVAKTEPAVAKTAPAIAKTEPAVAKSEPAPAVAKSEPAVAKTAAPSALVDIRVDSNPSGATVNLIDRGKSMYLGTTPLSVAVDPSRKYELVFSYENRTTLVQALDPAAQKRVSVRLSRVHSHSSSASSSKSVPAVEAPKSEEKKVEAKPEKTAKTEKAEKAEKAEKSENEPAAKAAPVGEGTLMISSKPPCEIIVDGKPTGLTTPQRSIPLAAGAHKITLVNSADGIKKTVSVQITADKPTKVIQDFMK